MTTLSEVAMFSEDVQATVAFYEKVLQAAPTATSKWKAVFDIGGVTLMVHETEPDAEEEDHIAFAVPDLDATCSALRAEGIDVDGPARYDWGRCAYLRDPDGRRLELHAEGGIQY